MIRGIARAAALAATAIDLGGALERYRYGHGPITTRRAAIASALALVPCALAFGTLLSDRWRRRALFRGGSLRLPVFIPRGYLGAAVLGGIASVSAMGERFGLYVFMAGIMLIALALSQALPKRS